MVDIPPEVAIKATIKPGSVYYFPHDSFHSTDPHYFVVINIDPINERVILLVCASSKISKIKARYTNCPVDALVKISPSQYPDFKVNSIFDCNQVIEETIDQLIERLLNKRLKLKAEMDIRLVERLRKGVLSSRLVSGKIKAQLSRVSLA